MTASPLLSELRPGTADSIVIGYGSLSSGRLPHGDANRAGNEKASHQHH